MWLAVFSFALDYKGKVNESIEKIGKDYSTWIYIIHPIFITIFTWLMSKIGAQQVWGYIGPIVIFVVSLMFVASTSHIKYNGPLVKTAPEEIIVNTF